MPIDDSPARKPVAQAVGVPRRFAVGTLMIIVTMYSLLFAALTWLGADRVLFAMVAILFTAVGAAQMLLFRGTKPREASYLAGSLLCPMLLLAAFLGDRLLGLRQMSPRHIGIETTAQLLSGMAYLAIVGVLLGYVAGCAAAGVFFVMDRMQKAGGYSDPQMDEASSLSADQLARGKRPSADERVWNWIKTVVVAVSPHRKYRPIRQAANTAIVIAILVGLAAPFLPWAGWLHAVVTIATAIVVALMSTGIRLCGRKSTLTFLVLGGVGALGPGIILRRLHLFPMGWPLPGSVLLLLTVILGCLAGLLAAATLGWAAWLLKADDTKKQRRNTARRLGIGIALVLMSLYAALSFLLFQHPRQQALALVNQAVRFVDLSGTEVDDTDLQCLSVFENLSYLGLAHTQITDVGLEHLQGLSSLSLLSLDRTQVTDAGLEHFKNLNNLSNLSLASTQITGAGLAHLKGLTSLTYLNLAGTQVTGDGLAHLRGLAFLVGLDLSGTQLTDAGLVHLKGLTGLQELGLGGTQVTDAGLKHLKGLTNLQRLDLQNTQVTQKGVQELEKALPNCTIAHDASLRAAEQPPNE